MNALVTGWTESELVWLFVASGFAALLARGLRPAVATAAAFCLPLPWLVTGLGEPATPATLSTICVFFAKAGAFVFGSGLAIVPFLHGGVVNELHWLTERQFLDAVAVAMITPGPVVITVAFIGYLVAGPIGATLAALAIFLPCYLFVVIPARYFRRAIHDARVKAFVERRDGRGRGRDRRRRLRPRAPRDRRSPDGRHRARRARPAHGSSRSTSRS